jgi:hypothetical protein
LWRTRQAATRVCADEIIDNLEVRFARGNGWFGKYTFGSK